MIPTLSFKTIKKQIKEVADKILIIFKFMNVLGKLCAL